MATLVYGHTHSDLIPLAKMHTHYAVNSTTDNANFVHQIAQFSCTRMCESAVKFGSHRIRTYNTRIIKPSY